LCILAIFPIYRSSAQTITVINYELDDQSLIAFRVSDEITSAPDYAGFSVTIDGVPATFQDAAPTQLGIQSWSVNLNETILPGQTVVFSYSAPPGTVLTTAGALQSTPPTTIYNNRNFQCTDFTNSGQFNLFISGVCTPIDKIQQYQGLMKLAMANSQNFDQSKLLVRFDWNDAAGNYDYVPISFTLVDPFTGFEFRAQEQHTYPKEDPCGYFVTMTPGYDTNGDGDLDDPVDFICAKGMNDDVVSEESIPFPAWETDEENTGSVQLDPIQIDHCINTPMDTLFNDATNYNCRIAALNNPPIVDDTAYANLRRRYVRFTYGTNPGRKIPNIYVNGVKVTDQNGDFMPAIVTNTLGGYEDPAGAILIPRTYPFTEQMLLQSLRITMPNPGYEQIGDVFEITLENWNICNPYAPGPGSYTNSIQRTARILIVGSEDPTGPVNGIYCDGEAVPSIRVNDNPWGAGNYVVWYDDFDPLDPSVGNQLYSSAPGQSGILTPPDTIAPGTTVSYWAAYEGECPSENRIEVTLTKNPKPVGIDVPAGTYIICSEDAVDIDPQLYTDIPGSSFTWTGDNGTSGTGNITDNPSNITNNEIDITYTVIPTSPPPASCPGDPFTIVVTVQPKPIVTPGLSQFVCSGDPANLVLTFDNSLTGGATFFWNNAPVTTGGMVPGPARPDPGNSDPITDTYVNTTLSNQTATYIVTGVSTASGCYGDPENVIITVVPEFTPSNDLSIADNTLCYNDDPGVISGSAPTGGTGVYTYQWQSSPDASSWSDISGATGAAYNPGPVTADIYFRRLEFSGPCLGISNEVFLDVTPELFPGVINPDQVICFGDTPNDLTGTLASGGEGAGTYVYQWQQSPDNISWSDLSNGDINYGAPVDVTAPNLSFTSQLPVSTYFRRMDVSGECTVYSNEIFIQSALSVPPQPVIDIGTANLCEGATNITYGISAPDPLDDPNGYTWTYDDGTPVISTNQMSSILYDFPTSGTVTITVVAWNGCGNGPVSNPYIVTVDQQPAADAGGPAGPDQCDLNYTFNATPSVGTGLWTKESGPGNVTSWGAGQDQPDANIIVDVYGTYTFRWTETNGMCSDFDEITVQFYEQPSATVGGDDDICNTLTYTLNATPYSYLAPPNVNASSRTWTLESGPAGGGIVSILPDANDPNPTVTVNIYGNDTPYVFRWTETNGSCSDYGEVSIYFREQPVSDAGLDEEACGLNHRLEANNPIVGIGTWSVVSQPAGSTVLFGNMNDEINDNDALTLVNVYGVYEFQWQVNNGPCMAADIVQITYREPVVVTTGGDQVIAEGTATAPLGGAITGGASSGTWSVVAGLPGGSFLPNSSDLNAVFDPSPAQDADGSVTLRLTSTDPAGICPAVFADVIITINENPDVSITSPADGAQFCADEIVNLNGEFSGSASEATWTTSGTGTFSQDVFNSSPFSTVYTPSVADTAAGVITITLTSDDPDGAGPVVAATTSINIILKPIPITSPINGPPEVCVSSGSELYRVDGFSGSPASSYIWTITPLDGNEPILNQLGNVAVLEFGPNPWSGTLAVVETTMGCSNTGVSIDVDAVGIPVADPGTDMTVCSDMPAILGGTPSATGGSGTYTYTWTPNVYLDDPNLANPTMIFTNTTGGQLSSTYQLVVTDVNTGCASLPVQVTVFVNPEPVLAPNLNNTVCSQTPSNIILNTNGSSIPAATYNIFLNGQDAGLIGIPTEGTGLLNTAIQNDIFENKTSIDQRVIYDIVPVSDVADGGCLGDVDQVTLTVRPEPILDPNLDVTICSEEPTNITLVTTGTSVPALLYEVALNTQDPELSGFPTTGTGLSNMIQNDRYLNVSADPHQVIYDIVPITSFGCRGELTPVTVTVDPQPVMDPGLNAIVCSGEPSGIIFNTDGISVGADSYTIFSITVSPLLSPDAGNASAGTGLAENAIENDIFFNTSIIPANVIYRVRPVSIYSCDGDLIDITLTVLPEPVVSPGLDKVICSDEETGLLLTTVPTSLPADFYNILNITVDPNLIPDTGNAVVADGVSTNVFTMDRFTNETNLPLDVVYEVLPVSADGCLGEPESITITVNPKPVMAEGLDNVVCSGLPSGITLDTDGVSVSADHFHIVSINVHPNLIPDVGNGTTGDNKTSSEIVNDIFYNSTASPLDVMYEVFPVSADGCEGDQILITLTVNPEPVMDPALDAMVCNENISGITFTSNGSSAVAATFNIMNIIAEPGLTPVGTNASIGDGQSANAILNDRFTNTANSPLTVTYEVIPVSVNGCTGEMENIVLTINPVPDVISTVTYESICNGERASFTLTTNISPAGNVHFDYFVSASAFISGYSSPVSGLVNGAQINDVLLSTSLVPEPVVYTITPYFNACVGIPIDVEFTINPSPTAVISGNAQICEGDTTSLTFTFTGAPPFSLEYEINNGTITTVNDINDYTYTVDVSPLFDTSYKIVSIYDGNGSTCSGTFSGQADVLVQETPVASFNMDKLSGCAPLSVNFDNFSTGNLQGPATGYYYRIQGDMNLIKFSSDLYTSYIFDNTTSSSIVYEVVFIAESSQGCTDMTWRDVTVDPSVQLDVTTNDPDDGCNYYTVTFNNNLILDGVIYVWEWGDGEANDTTRFESSISHTFVNSSTVSAKTFNVKVTGINPITGCEESMVHPIRVSPNIVLDLETDVSEGCGPLYVNAINRSGGVQNHTWFYRVKGTDEMNEVEHTTFVTYQLRNQTTDVLTYELIYTGENWFGCQESDTLEVVVWPELNADFIASPERQILPNSIVTIQDLTNEGPWDYTWMFGDGNSSTDPDLQEYDYGTYGIYQIILEVSIGPCTDNSSQTITIEPITPIVDFDAAPREGCSPLTVDFINKSKYADPTTYYWEFGDGVGFSNAENPSFTFYEPGVYSVSLEASNELGIVVRQEYEMFITVFETPIAQFRVRPSTVYVPDQPVYTANLSYGATQYFWDFGDEEGIDDTSTEEEPIYYYTNPGVYDIFLWVANDEGCMDSVIVYKAVTAEPGGNLAAPNVFTPSPDGPNGGVPGDVAFNDVFLPIERGAIEFHMQIFNRWGELLFESWDKNIGWDGYYKGRLAKSDVYIYRLDLKLNDGRRVTRLGDVFLLR